MLAPVVSPFGNVVPLDGENELTDGLRQVTQPGVVFVGVLGGGGQQFDYRPQGSIGTQNGPLGALVRLLLDLRKILVQDALHFGEVLKIVADEHRPIHQHIRDRLGDFRFASARHGAWLVTKCAVRHRAHQTPTGTAELLFEPHAIAGGQHVNLVGHDVQLVLASVPRPGDEAFADIECGALGDVDDAGENAVDSVTFRFPVHTVLQKVSCVLDRDLLYGRRSLRRKFVAQHVRGIGDSAAGVFLLASARQVRRVADMAFDLFLAITVIVVGNNRDDDPAAVAAHNFERPAIVVQFFLVAPAHAIAALALGRVFEAREAEVLFQLPHQVRRKDGATRVAGPVRGVERGVVFRQIGIAAVAKDGLHEIQVADQRPGREKAYLHCLLGIAAGGWTHHGTQQQADEDPRLLLFFLIGGEGQGQRIGRRAERLRQKLRERQPGHGCFVGRHRQSVLDDMKQALRCAPVALRIVENSLGDAIRMQVRGRKTVHARRQRQCSRHPRPVEGKGVGRQSRRSLRTYSVQIGIQKLLHAGVGGAQPASQQLILLIEVAQ